MIKRIKQGELFVIAPEGTRSQAESLGEGRHGADYIASKTCVPVVPVALTGTKDRIIKDSLLRWQRLKVVITIGDPFVLLPIERENRVITLQTNTDKIMCQIAALMLSQYHSIYAAHTTFACNSC